MKTFQLGTAINQLGLGKTKFINTNLKEDNTVPDWATGLDLWGLFLPRLTIIGDSREQDKWIKKACDHYGIAYEEARKTKDTDNLKEGDYSFKVTFDIGEHSYVGEVAYERKGSISEFYGNCQSGRTRVKKEFERFGTKQYDKVVLMLQFANKLSDLYNLKFSYYGSGGEKIVKETGKTPLTTIMSWKQPNNNNFDILMSTNKAELFWLMILDMFYYFRQDVRLECISKNLIENVEN